jgi:FkbM family methyltransferase
MSLREQVKQLLRMCGHAFVRTVHERLDVLERQDNDLGLQIASLAETQGALLQASIHVVENLHQVQKEAQEEKELAQQLHARLNSLHEEMAGLAQRQRTENQEEARRQHLRLESVSAGIASLSESQCALQEAVLAIQRDGRCLLDREPSLQVCVETSDYEFRNPEVGLMIFLYSSLPTRTAIDVGAHVGEVSECLLSGGYEVFAFEPNPSVYERLIRRLGNRPAFHSFNLALGSSEAEMPLHLAEDLSGSNRYVDQTAFSSLVTHSMPEDLPFTGSTTVSVKRLGSLHRSGLIPAYVSLVKIDTEGFDLDVVRGMGDYRYPVVVAEFWGKQTPFGMAGVPYTLESLVGEMRQLGYLYHIVFYRPYGQEQLSFYCNFARSLPDTCGNVFFFREYNVFAQAQAWCSAVLPRTYFKLMDAR